MLDINFIEKNKKDVINNALARNVKVDVNLILDLHSQIKKTQREIDELNQRRNEISNEMSLKDDKTAYAEESKEIKANLSNLKETQDKLTKQYTEEMLKVPNMTHADVPPGHSDAENIVARKEGIETQFNFKPKDHLEICEDLDLADFKAGAKVSGTKFYFLKNEAVLLEQALIQYALEVVMKHGFTPMTTPVIAKDSILSGAGFNPRGDENQIFSIEDSNMSLIGTSEITIGGYLADTVQDPEKLPIKMTAITECFRKETGGYGQINKGLYRVPFFKKVEMFQFVRPEDCEATHEEMLAIEEEIYKGLELPYRIINICAGDLGGPAYKKYDIEAWMPFIGENGGYGEVTSASNCTDFQARRWNIKYKDPITGEKRYVHTLNGTAIATTRVILAILENFQQSDGSVQIPKVLHKYMGGITVISKK